MVRKALNISYAYSATQNNGKITSETDALSVEQVLYTYDSLNRLASAQTAGAGGWGQSYTYDGFGNLTDQTLIKGTAPDVHVAYNYLTNRQTGDTADANGNIGSTNVYDMDNRLIQPYSGVVAPMLTIRTISGYGARQLAVPSMNWYFGPGRNWRHIRFRSMEGASGSR